MDANTTAPVPPLSLEQSFTVATALVTSALERGFTPRAASLKSQLLTELPGFDERQYGFRKFIDYLQAAAAAGHLVVDRDINNHPRIALPAPLVPALSSSTMPEQRRLRTDIWSAMVSWEEPSLRIWDRMARRAFHVPLGADGRPLWESESERFVEIASVPIDVHLGWMLEFASRCDAPARTALERSLAETAPPRSFKRALVEHELTAEWNTYLRLCVTNHALAWASANGVPFPTIVDVNAMKGAARKNGDLQSELARAAQYATPAIVASSSAQSDRTDALRRELHSIIDLMSLSELASLGIPAGYLVKE